jgi:DNA-binding MarR family transcriptional regulator
MSKTVVELEDRGFVARTTDAKDGRLKIVSLTPAGRRALVKGRRERDQYTAALLVSCSPNELAELLSGAQLLRKVMDQ